MLDGDGKDRKKALIRIENELQIVELLIELYWSIIHM